MNSNLLQKLVFAALLWPVFGSQALAQGQPATFAEDKISKEALIDALTPPRSKEIQTRSIRVQAIEADTRKEATLSRAKPSGKRTAKPQASLLVSFETASSELTSAAKKSLAIVAQALNSDRLVGLSFDVEGHADRRGEQSDNDALSQARAQSVVDFLSKELQISADRLRAVGKGSREPANLKNIDAPENRRVTFRTIVAAQ